jgi:subtilisin family serine protease
VRVLDKENKYDDPAVVAKGLHWAVDHGASVINLSLGGQLRSDVLAEALDYAASHDVVIVACTGNVSASSPSRDVWYPAREPGVVAVAGLVGAASATSAPSTVANTSMGGTGGASESLWSGSLTGSQTVLTAPAVNLLGAKPGGYWRVQGTSFAAPLVAATAALIRSRYPGMNAANVINRLIRTARDLGPPGRDDRYGYGEVDPLAALRIDAPPVTANPLGGASSIAAGSTEGAAPSPSRAVDASGGHGSPLPSKLPAGVQSTGARDSNHAGGSGVGMAARVASSERRLGASMAIGGAVAALLFMVGLLVSRSRRKTP